MNKVFSIIKVLILSGVLFAATSCDDLMLTESNRYMRAEDNQLNSPNDTVFSILGILHKMQQIGDRYILMGELRADLLDVTDMTKEEIRDLNNHTINPDNSPFSDISDYYAIINNCNYFIQTADTNVSVRGLKSFVREVNVARSIRAWTYMQLGLNYGQARYIMNPILSVADLDKNYPDLSLEQLIDTLIAEVKEINPETQIILPGYGNIGEAASRYLFISPRFLLGDLYLWRASFTNDQQDYQLAAHYYSRLMVENQLTITGNTISWTNDLFRNFNNNWSSMFTNSTSNSELVSIIKMSRTTYNGTVSALPIMARNLELKVSGAYQALSDEQTYCHRENLQTPARYTTGDMRIRGVVTRFSQQDTFDPNAEQITRISKYDGYNIMIYRSALAYLRYAEAVNRAGKPSLAFAVLKNGLKTSVINNPALVKPHEIRDAEQYYMVFTSNTFDGNIGINNRGAGNAAGNEMFVIPDYTRRVTLKDINGNDSIVVTSDPLELAAALTDSITFVENRIAIELALETAMEGNRFHDLMRLSNHRNDPTFLATRVSRKHPANKDYYFTLLSDKNNWFIPMRGN